MGVLGCKCSMVDVWVKIDRSDLTLELLISSVYVCLKAREESVGRLLGGSHAAKC